jgi:hypothetical protein
MHYAQSSNARYEHEISNLYGTHGLSPYSQEPNTGPYRHMTLL